MIRGLPWLFLVFSVFIVLASSVWVEGLEPDVVLGLGWLQQAKLSPDAELVATCSDSALHVWRISGSLVGVFRCPDGVFFLGCEWSRDGSRIAIANVIGRLTLVRVSDMSMEGRMERGDLGSPFGCDCWSWRENTWGFSPYPLKWSPNNSLLAHGWCNEMIQFYDVENKSFIKAYRPGEPEGDIECLDWSPDSEYLLIGGTGFIRLLDADDFVSVLNLPSRSRVAALSPNGTLISLVNETTIYIYSVGDGEVLASLKISSKPTSLAWSRDSSLLIIGTVNGRIVSWKGDEDGVVSSISAHSSRILSLSSVSSFLASTSADQTTKTWSFDSDGFLSLIHVFSGWGPAIRSLYWSSGTDLLVAAHSGCVYPVRTYGLDGSELLRIGSFQGCEEYVCAVPSPDGKMIATIHDRYKVSIWDGVYGTLAARIDTSLRACAAEWCPTKPGILALAGRGGVEIYDVDSGELLTRIGGFTDEEVDETYGLDWSPDGKMLSIGFLSRIEIWDPWLPRLLASKPDWSYVGTPVWAPDGCKIAYVSIFDSPRDEWGNMHPSCFELWQIGKLTILEVNTHQGQEGKGVSLIPISEILLPSSGRRQVDWSPNSTIVAVGIGSQEYELGMQDQLMECFGIARPGIILWQLSQTGAMPVMNLTGPSRGVSTLDWSSNGSRIAAGSNDGTIWVWSLPKGLLPEPTTNILYLSMITLLIQPHIKNLVRSKRHNSVGSRRYLG